MKQFLIAILLTAGWLTADGQPRCSVTKYDEADGVASSHVTQLLQDEQGFMWFATWNGLCRYDGYEFKTFKSGVGDGCRMTTDRIRNITLLPGGAILCQVDEDSYMFDLHTYRFRNLTDAEEKQAQALAHQHRKSQSIQRKPYTWTDAYHTQWTFDGQGRLSYLDERSGQQADYPLDVDFHTPTFAMTDNKGNLWVLDYGSIYKMTTDVQRTRRLPIEPRAEVKCLFADSQGRYWVATRGDEALRIYRRSDNSLLGYLGADGQLHQQYTRFGAAVYCMYERKDGTIWLGAKPQGLYRLQPTEGQSYKISHFIDLPHTDIYHITEDTFGRLWVATLGGGVYYTNDATADQPQFVRPRHYPDEGAQRVRYIHITRNHVWLAATGNGLLVSRLEQDADRMTFRQHQRDSQRSSSLSCSATMDVVEDSLGRIYVSTESGGVNLIESDDLLAETLDFHHFRDDFQAESNDIVQSLSITGRQGLMAVGSHLITLFGGERPSRILDADYFQDHIRFSEAHPLALGDGRWLFGLMDGAFITTMQQMTANSATPALVFSCVSVQGGNSDYAVEMADSVILQPHERSLTVRFAALDFSAPERINYAFRLAADEQWNYIGHDRSATLLDLAPGTYVLEVRSTNADGEWQDNIHRLCIVVLPTFWESSLGRLLILLMMVVVIATVVYTFIYIRRMKRKQRETLEAYLSLLEGARGQEQPATTAGGADVRAADAGSAADKSASGEIDPMLQSVMSFIEENLSNSDATVGDMALAAAVSRSGLQRKLKQTMGVTPQELLHEARIKHACQLLRHTDRNVSDIAYACGFTDPKYFSRCFRQRMQQSPTDYRNAAI